MAYLTAAERKAIESGDQNITSYAHALQRETLLEDIETSVHPTIRAQLRDLEERANRSAERFETPKNHARKSQFLDALRLCSQVYAVFEVDGLPILHPMRCRIRACPICAEVSSRRWYIRLKSEAQSMSALKHITLTLKSSDDPLPHQITRLLSAFHNLRRQKFWRSRTPWGYWAVEITRNTKTQQWHPHLHVLANTSYIDCRVMSEGWKLATSDSDVVKIKAVRSDRAKYIAKYQSKGSALFEYGLDPYEIAGQIKGRRFFQRFGRWPIIHKPDSPVVAFVGTVHGILTRWAHGEVRAAQIGSWLWSAHPEAIYQAVKHPPPRTAW